VSSHTAGVGRIALEGLHQIVVQQITENTSKGVDPMNRASWLAALVLCLATVATAQDDAEYQRWLTSIGAAAGNLRKNRDAKTGDTAAADVKTLQENFAIVRAFWEKKSVANAVKFSTESEAGFKKVGELAVAGEFEETFEAMKTPQATCEGFHNAHRKNAEDGSWKIK
jgi:hypothetical protein